MAPERRRGWCRRALVLAATALAIAPVATDAGPSAATPGSGPVSWIGPLVGADSLANTRVGGPYGTVVAYGFQAPWTGPISSVRMYVVLGDGYSDGTRGTLRISIVPDRGGPRHGPGERKLASVDYKPPGNDSWPLVRFPRPAHMETGRRYYVVFTNVDPHPRDNYVSVNALLSSAAGATPPPLPGKLRVYLGDSTDGGRTPARWRSRSQDAGKVYVPIIDIRGRTNEQAFGLGYMESWVSNPKPIGAESAVRERFTFESTKPAHVTEARVRVRRASPAATPLQVRLETQDGGRTLATADVPASSIDDADASWVVAPFTSRPTITPGMKLALVLRSAEAGSYETFPLRDGSEFGFAPQTVFTSGYAEFLSGGTWTGWDQWDATNRRDGDLQFALRLER